MRLALAALLLFVPGVTLAQHDHGRAPSGDEPRAVVETFVVTGLRVSPEALPPGSAVGRAGLRYADGGYVSVVYGKPYARGRVIWGGVVAYDQVWAAGAHRATELATTVPLTIGETRVEPGIYALFVTPGAETWTLHVNRRPGQHLAGEYDPDEDVARVSVAAESRSGTDDGLVWQFAEDGAALVLTWADRSSAFPIARAD